MDIEDLTTKLGGTIKLMQVTLDQMESDCLSANKADEPSIAIVFLKKTEGFYMDCLNHLLTSFEEIENGINAEIDASMNVRKAKRA